MWEGSNKPKKKINRLLTILKKYHIIIKNNMKKILFILATVFVLSSCGSNQGHQSNQDSTHHTVDSVAISADSTSTTDSAH